MPRPRSIAQITATALALSLASTTAAFAQVPVGSASYYNGALTNSVVIAKGVALQTTPGAIDAVACSNTSTLAYVQFFDVADSTAVTLGTTPPKFVIPFPASTSWGMTFGAGGVYFQNGIKLAATGTATGAGAPGAALSCTLIFR